MCRTCGSRVPWRRLNGTLGFRVGCVCKCLNEEFVWNFLLGWMFVFTSVVLVCSDSVDYIMMNGCWRGCLCKFWLELLLIGSFLMDTTLFCMHGHFICEIFRFGIMFLDRPLDRMQLDQLIEFFRWNYQNRYYTSYQVPDWQHAIIIIPATNFH